MSEQTNRPTIKEEVPPSDYLNSNIDATINNNNNIEAADGHNHHIDTGNVDPGNNSDNHDSPDIQDDDDTSSPNTGGEKKSSKNKRKYNFQRASVACEQCRKAKTRCNYINNGTNCFRCENLSLKCSLNDIKIEPTLSTFQKAAKLTTRDEVDEIKALKKRKKSKNSPAFLLASSDQKSLKNQQVVLKPADMSASSYITPPPVSTTDSALLAIINDKIDKLSSSLKILIDQKDSLASTPTISNPLRNTPINVAPPLNPIASHQSATTLPSFNKLSSASSVSPQAENPNIPSFLYPIRPNFQTSSNLIPNNPPNLLQRPITAPLARPYFQTTNFQNQQNNGNTNPPLQNSTFPPPIVTNPVLNKDENIDQSNGFANNNHQSIMNNNAHNSNNNSHSNSTNGNASMVHENDEFFFLNAPYLDMSNIACNLGLPFTKEIGFDITRDATLNSIQERYDLINRKLLDYDSCYRLIEVALLHYAKWITYVEVDFKAWFDSIRITSPLLFCVLVLLGLRHNRPPNIDKNLDLDILQSIHQLLSLTIYEIPQSKEFIQVSILLSQFSPSLSYKHIYFDSWWISSYGLIHFMTREMNMNLLVKSVKSAEKIHQYRLWNHLTLAHLINCILSGRPCIIDEIRLDQCRDILVLPEANSFDAIIVAKICIILTLYNSLQFPENLDVSLKELDSTYSDWKYLTDNTPLGGVVTGFYLFGKIMVLRRYLLNNPYLKNQPDYIQRGYDFLNTVIAFVDLGKANEELLNGSDLLKQSFFLSVFMLLQFKQLNIIKESNDFIILDCINKFMGVLGMAESKAFYFNGYVHNYGELIMRFKNMLFH